MITGHTGHIVSRKGQQGCNSAGYQLEPSWVYARKIVGWRVSTSPHAGLVLDSLEQTVYEL